MTEVTKYVQVKAPGAKQQQVFDSPPDTPAIPLCPEQLRAVEIIEHSGVPVIILTGQAGSGKSTIINHLRKMRNRYTVCATTGKAAMHVDGSTVDSVFCINRTEWKIWSNSYQEKIMREIPDRIIIDEASMIGLNMANLIEEARSTFSKQIILVGDWAQARPVKDEWITGSDLLASHTVIKLMENHRQDTDKPYMDLLNKLRIGNTDEACNTLMRTRERGKPDSDADLRLYATNAKVENYNGMRFYGHVNASLCGYVKLNAEFKDERKWTTQTKTPRNQAFMDKAIEQSRLANNEPIAIGCRALITVNDPDGQFVNGDTGVITGIEGPIPGLQERLRQQPKALISAHVRYIKVKLDRTEGEVTIYEMIRQVKEPSGDAIQHKIFGFPVVLGYACTIHKAQGMTVNRAWVDLPSIMAFPTQESRHGLAYVALSRTRTLEGLTVSRWVPETVYCDPAIKDLI